MPIKVDCQSCGHRYQVGDNMAGKKVKCKTCGAIITIPSADEEFDFSAVEVQAPATPQPARNVPPKARPPAVDDDYEGPGDVRPAPEADPAYGFAGAKVLENIVPIVLAAGGLGWMVVQAARSDESGHGWVGPFRAAAYLLAYVALMYPLALVGVRAAGRKAYFAMPSAYHWKVFAIFSLPAALGAIFTLSNPSVGMLIAGLLLGLVVALGAFIFVFNIRPHQMGLATAIASGYVLGGAVLAAGLLLGLNYLVLAALTMGKTAYQYTLSPVGPQFSWNAPPPPDDAVKSKSHIVASVDTTEPPTTEPVAATQPTTMPIVAATLPSTTQVVAATNPADTQPSTKPIAEDTTEPKPSSTPFLASAPTALSLGAFQDAFFTPSGGAPTILVLATHAEFGDAFEVWNPSGATWAKTVAFTAQPKSMDRGAIVMNPKGTSMARMVEFPRVSVEVRSLAPTDAADVSKLKKVDPDTAHGNSFELVGLTNPGHAIVLGVSGEPFIDVLDSMINSSGPASQRNGLALPLAGLPMNARCNLVMGPDPRYIASVRHVNGSSASVTPGNALFINGLLGNRSGWKYGMTGLAPNGPVNVTGLTFSPDGMKVAMMYQENGNGLIEIYQVPNARQLGTHIFNGPAASPANDFRGSALTWMADGATFLINGRYLMNAETFEEIGDLGVANVKDVHIVDRDTLALLTRENNGKSEVLIAKLNPVKFHPAVTRPTVGHSALNSTTPLTAR